MRMRLIDADALCNDLLERWSIADTQKEELVRAVMADIVTPIVVSQPTIEPNHIEYTESEMKILELMFHIIKETIEMQNGYMEIDYVSFDRGDLYNLAEKLGIGDY